MAIKYATSRTADISGIIREIDQPNIKVVIYFFSMEFELSAPHKAFTQAFPRAACMGASMNGGYSPAGVLDTGIIALSFSTEEVAEASVFLQEKVREDPVQAARNLIDDFKHQFGYRIDNPSVYLGILFVDGLCLGELITQELLLETAINFPIVGGAAAENFTFVRTLVSANERISGDGVTLMVMKMNIPFVCGHFMHYIPEKTSYIVTRAEPKKRILWELDGKPAAEVYTKAIGVSNINKLDSTLFALHPFGVVVSNDIYARSLLSVTKDGGGLNLYCGVEAGTRLHILRQGDIIAHARNVIHEMEDYLPNIEGAIIFNCAFRLLELQALGKHEEFCNVFSGLKFIGFNTYGEELFSYYNQTLTTVFFGRY
jgi:hypothetical protein